MAIDPRIEIVIKSVQRVVEATGGGIAGTMSPEQLVQLLAACGADDACRAALVGLVYGAAEIAARADREAREGGQLEAQMRATLAAGNVRR